MTQLPESGRQRAVIENVRPRVDDGQFPIKRIVGDTITVDVDAFADGHDELVCVLLDRPAGEKQWRVTPMEFRYNDEWRASFTVDRLGTHEYTVRAWIDRFHTWLHALEKRIAANQDLAVDLLIGAELVGAAAQRASGADRARLGAYYEQLAQDGDQSVRKDLAQHADLLAAMDRNPDLSFATTAPIYQVTVDRPLAECGAWYELFPYSASKTAGAHGTFRDVQDRLGYVEELGFDVLYLPPIHPVGVQFRKGKNNAPQAEPDDIGSPWAIGGAEGGHMTVNPRFGTLEDFRALVSAAKSRGIEIAMDIAFQCAPDHPYAKQHRRWFRERPDGTIQYAENPPKKYQDIYPFDFESEDWRAMWTELRDVFLFWIKQGVTVFRVDNPHTKALPFWHWCIGEVKRVCPEAIFLSEAFTRPKVMYRLAKVGFSQSYTYFSWRNTKAELTEYCTELTTTSVKEYFRPNFWPNTPDILPASLQTGLPSSFAIRYLLAATLAANYGIYGPAFELLEHVPREAGSEEYLHSEKYQIRSWPLDDPRSLRGLIKQTNQIRRANAALRRNNTLRFHTITGDWLLAYSKTSPDGSNIVLMVINLDPHAEQGGWLQLPYTDWQLDPSKPLVAEDLLTGVRYEWSGEKVWIQLDPAKQVGHVLKIRRWTGHDGVANQFDES